MYGAEVMSADQTVTTGQFPTAAQFTNGLCWRKSSLGSASTTERAWTLIGDEKTFYLLMNDNATTITTNTYAFGDFISLKSGDAYNCFINGMGAFNNGSTTGNLGAIVASGTTTAVAGCYVARTYAQSGSAINVSMMGYGGGTLGNSTIYAYPNAADAGALFAPVMIIEPTGTLLRGRMPGFYNILHNAAFNHYDQITGVTGLSGVTLVVLASSYIGSATYFAIDKTGLWT